MKFAKFITIVTFIILGACLNRTVLAQSFETRNITIFFDSDQADLTQESKKHIRNFILELGTTSIKEIYISGHTDSDASNEYNQELSQRRALSAKDFLLLQGVKDRMIRMEHFGEAQPTSSKKSKNRRVELTFIVELADTPLSSSLKVKSVYVTTIDASTGQALLTSFSIEVSGKNKFGKSNKKGQSTFSGHQLQSNVVFSKEGYLNKVLNLPKEISGKEAKDTLHLTVRLSKVRVLQKLRFENIFFYTDSDVLKPESKPELEKLFQMLDKFPNMYIEIQGHMNFAANRKTTTVQKMYNLDLSYRRAKAVYHYLVENGINPGRLTYKGMSNLNMIYPFPQSRSEEDMNKRVEVWTLEVNADNSN